MRASGGGNTSAEQVIQMGLSLQKNQIQMMEILMELQTMQKKLLNEVSFHSRKFESLEQQISNISTATSETVLPSLHEEVYKENTENVNSSNIYVEKKSKDFSMREEIIETLMDEKEGQDDPTVAEPPTDFMDLAKDLEVLNKKSYVVGENRYKEKLEQLTKSRSHSSFDNLRTSTISNSSKTRGHMFFTQRREAKTKNRTMQDIITSHFLHKQSSFSIKKSLFKAFEEFYLLSVKNSLESFRGYKSPFHLRFYPNLLDFFHSSKSNAPDLNAEEISSFCFPAGAKVCIIPKSTIRRAKTIGWVRPHYDYQLHTFTDSEGDVKHGISITVQELVQSYQTPFFLRMRQKCFAAKKILKFLRNHKATKSISTSNVETSNYNYLSRLNVMARETSFRAQRRFSMPSIVSEAFNVDYKSEAVPDVPNNKTYFDSSKSHKRHVWAKAMDSYQYMIQQQNEYMCFVEKSYVVIGTALDNSCLLLNALQQLVEFEQLQADSYDRSFQEKDVRHAHLINIQSKATLEQQTMKRRYSMIDVIDNLKDPNKPTSSEKEFELRLFSNLPTIVLPLPLPKMTNEWGVATLFVRTKVSRLIRLLSLLLLERSTLVIGMSSADVTFCSQALLDLLKPYQWASAFIPLLPDGVLEFVSSPVPFIAGYVADSKKSLELLLKSPTIKNSSLAGMSILNVTSGKIYITCEPKMNEIAKNSNIIIDSRLPSYQRKLQGLYQKKTTNLSSFERFFQYGANKQELAIINSMKDLVSNHFRNLFHYSISSSRGEYKRYGQKNLETRAFEFYPSRLVSQLQYQLVFQEYMAHTQLFIGYVEELNYEDAALFIADWVYFQWRILRQSRKLSQSRRSSDMLSQRLWDDRQSQDFGMIDLNASTGFNFDLKF